MLPMFLRTFLIVSLLLVASSDMLARTSLQIGAGANPQRRGETPFANLAMVTPVAELIPRRLGVEAVLSTAWLNDQRDVEGEKEWGPIGAHLLSGTMRSDGWVEIGGGLQVRTALIASSSGVCAPLEAGAGVDYHRFYQLVNPGHVDYFFAMGRITSQWRSTLFLRVNILPTAIAGPLAEVAWQNHLGPVATTEVPPSALLLRLGWRFGT